MTDQNQTVPVEVTSAEPAEPERVMARSSFWGAVTIMLIWVAVMLIGVLGEEQFVVESGSDAVRVPVVLGVSFFAFLATWIIAVVSFRRG